MLNKVYRKGLDAIAAACGSGVTHPNDFQRVVTLFDRLLATTLTVGPADHIAAHLTSLGMDAGKAGDVQLVYEALYRRYYGEPAKWGADFLDDLEAEARLLARAE